MASGGMAEVFVAESAGIEGFKKTVAIKRGPNGDAGICVSS